MWLNKVTYLLTYFRGNEQLFAANKRKMFRSSIGPEGCAIANVMFFPPLLLILSTSLISISYSFVSFYRGFAFLTGVYVKYLLQNRFAFFISLFDLSAILKIRNWEHAHYVGLVDAYTWNREKQMFVAMGKEFDMLYMLTVDASTFSQKKASRQRGVSRYKLVWIQFLVPAWLVHTWGLIFDIFYTLLGSVYLRVIFNLFYTLLGSVYLRVIFNLLHTLLGGVYVPGGYS